MVVLPGSRKYMPLINSINGELLRQLAAASGGSTSGGGSTVAGKGVSTTFEGDSVNLSAGLSTAATAFSNSYVRISSSVSRIDITRDTLSSLTDLASRLYSLASQSADLETTTEERGLLNSEYESLITEFRTVLSDASKLTEDVYENSIDVLDSGDLRSVLGDSGINLSAETVLSEAFSLVGGDDGDLGYERVVLDDGTEVDPLSQDIDTRANAINAKDALGKLKDVIADDVESVGTVLTELRAAKEFAFEATVAADELSRRILDSSDADAIAKELVTKIKQQASDPAISAHSSLDTVLVSDLLG